MFCSMCWRWGRRVPDGLLCIYVACMNNPFGRQEPENPSPAHTNSQFLYLFQKLKFLLQLLYFPFCADCSLFRCFHCIISGRPIRVITRHVCRGERVTYDSVACFLWRIHTDENAYGLHDAIVIRILEHGSQLRRKHPAFHIFLKKQQLLSAC